MDFFMAMSRSERGRESRRFKCTAVAEHGVGKHMTMRKFVAVITIPLFLNVVTFAGAERAPAGGRSKVVTQGLAQG
jgi:hypothetical protein